MKEIKRLFVLPMLIGILGGFSAILVREIIHYSSVLVDTVEFYPHYEYLYLIFIPFVFLFSSIIIHKFLPDTTNPTIDSVAKSIVLKKGRLDYKKGLASVVLTSINIGFGVPVGREGPIAKFGASFTALFLKLFKTKGVNTPLFVTCGVTSALAATFNAPIAAIVFGFEIILGRLNFNYIIPLSISSITATIVSRYFIGNYPTFYVHKFTYNHLFLIMIPLFALAFSLMIIFFESIYKTIIKSFAKLHISYYKKAFIGGIVVSLLLYLYPDAASLGYNHINELFNSKYSFHTAFELSIVKAIAIALTFASGMFGGVFAPSIFIGAFFGFGLGSLTGFFTGIDPLAIALIGTAAVTAGMSNAPFRSSLIIIELTQNYQMAVPILLTSVLTIYIVHTFEEKIHFARAIMQKGFDIGNAEYRKKLENLEITHLIDDDIIVLEPKMYIKDIVYDLMDGTSSYFPVVENKKLVGVLSFRDIRLIKDKENYNDTTVNELMTHNPHALNIDANGMDVFEFISHIDAGHIPIVNNQEDHLYMGMLDIHAFKKFVSFLYLEKDENF